MSNWGYLVGDHGMGFDYSRNNHWTNSILHELIYVVDLFFSSIACSVLAWGKNCSQSFFFIFFLFVSMSAGLYLIEYFWYPNNLFVNCSPLQLSDFATSASLSLLLPQSICCLLKRCPRHWRPSGGRAGPPTWWPAGPPPPSCLHQHHSPLPLVF